MAQNKNYKKGSGGNKSRNYNRDGNKSNNKNNQRDGNRSNRDNYNKGGNGQQNAPKGDQAPSKSKPPKKSPSSDNDLLWFVLVMILVAGGFLFNKYYLGPRRPGIYNSNYVSPSFKKEGRLSFIDAQAGKNIIDLDIEVAKTPAKRNVGLKNRKFLPANGGFLYVFGEEDIRTFTMEGVLLSLDILFIDSKHEIIRISRNTTPRSPASIPSGGKVQYVLQVQGGFCGFFNIRVGDYVEF